MNYRFSSCFASQLTAYVNLRRALGLRFTTQSGVLQQFDRYLVAQQYAGPLSQEVALAFATAEPAMSAAQNVRRYHTVRNFSLFLVAILPETPRLDPKALVARKTQPPTHIYSDEEICQLMRLARTPAPRKPPICGHTLATIIGLAASTGLRVSETVSLDRADVDFTTGILLIRCSKFGKDRLVPMHATTVTALQQYAGLRDLAYPTADSPAFFLSRQGTRLVPHTVSGAFFTLDQQANWQRLGNTRHRFHDLRHTFAVRRLIAWYRDGQDVQALLPMLATYMGHCSYVETAYYITAVPELLELAAQRVQQMMAVTQEVTV